MTECVQDKEFSISSASQYFTWMTPPPLPPDRNCSGSCNAFPSQSIITTSSSVHAGLAIYKQLKLGMSQNSVDKKNDIECFCCIHKHIKNTSTPPQLS